MPLINFCENSHRGRANDKSHKEAKDKGKAFYTKSVISVCFAIIYYYDFDVNVYFH